MSEKAVHLRDEGRVGWIQLDRPPLNILNVAMMQELAETIGAAAGQFDVMVIAGAGPKGFCAGADVGDHLPGQVGEMLRAFHQVVGALWNADALSVAAVHGWCLGGGCELAMACDFVVAAESAVFGQPEIKLGALPPVAMVLLPLLVGPRTAWDMILTGRNVPAGEARELGLVTRLVPEEGFDPGVRSLVEELTELSPAVLKMARKELWRRARPDFEKELSEVEAFYLERLMRTGDAAEGIRAFLEKRAPVWTGH